LSLINLYAVSVSINVKITTLVFWFG